MDIRKALEDLRESLVSVTSEDVLLPMITGQLTALRNAFPSQKALFTSDDIEFLKSLTPIAIHLQSFIELREELPAVRTLAECTDVLKRLICIKGALGDLPVGRRVGKEIRELNQRLPAIRDSEEYNLEFRIAGRISTLQENPRRCGRGHPMVIRNSGRDYFWACSRYPFCSDTARLTAEERDLLR